MIDKKNQIDNENQNKCDLSKYVSSQLREQIKNLTKNHMNNFKDTMDYSSLISKLSKSPRVYNNDFKLKTLRSSIEDFNNTK